MDNGFVLVGSVQVDKVEEWSNLIFSSKNEVTWYLGRKMRLRLTKSYLSICQIEKLHI